MGIARSIVLRIDELRLRQARAEARRAMVDFLRADWLDIDTDRPARRVALATARAARLEAALRRASGPQ